jgi:hypothetical protein
MAKVHKKSIEIGKKVLEFGKKFTKIHVGVKISCRNPTLAKCGGEAQHLEKVRI